MLDLCSAANSHLPPALPLSVQGLGMSAAELAANPRLDSHWVQDLNRQPRLSSLRDSSLDAVLCACGVQYLQQPEAVFLEVRRVLRPGGLFIISFSSHCWEEKAIAGWLARPSLAARAQLVQQALAAAGFPPSEAALWEPEAAGQEGGSSCDPFAAVLASRLAAEQEQAEELTPPALRHMEAAADGGGVSAAVLECWVFAYRQVGWADGIPPASLEGGRTLSLSPCHSRPATFTLATHNLPLPPTTPTLQLTRYHSQPPAAPLSHLSLLPPMLPTRWQQMHESWASQLPPSPRCRPAHQQRTCRALATASLASSPASLAPASEDLESDSSPVTARLL